MAASSSQITHLPCAGPPAGGSAVGSTGQECKHLRVPAPDLNIKPVRLTLIICYLNPVDPKCYHFSMQSIEIS